MPVDLSLTQRNDSKLRISTPSILSHAGCIPMDNHPLQVNGVLEYSVMLSKMRF